MLHISFIDTRKTWKIHWQRQKEQHGESQIRTPSTEAITETYNAGDIETNRLEEQTSARGNDAFSNTGNDTYLSKHVSICYTTSYYNHNTNLLKPKRISFWRYDPKYSIWQWVRNSRYPRSWMTPSLFHKFCGASACTWPLKFRRARLKKNVE